MKSLAERLVFARGRAGLSQSQLARAVKVSASAINQVEKGHTKSLRATTAQAIERATGVSARWLLTGRGEPAAKLSGSTSEQVERIARALEELPKPYRDRIEAEIAFLRSLQGEGEE